MVESERPVQIPVFPSSNFDRTAAFYSVLGFSESNRYGDRYLIIGHDFGFELHFFKAGRVKATRNDHASYLRFTRAEASDALYANWAAAVNTTDFAFLAGKAGRLVAPIDTDYGLREFALLDPDGNLLRIGGVIASPSTTHHGGDVTGRS